MEIKKCRCSLEQAPQNNGIFSIAKKNSLSRPYFQTASKTQATRK